MRFEHVAIHPHGLDCRNGCVGPRLHHLHERCVFAASACDQPAVWRVREVIGGGDDAGSGQLCQRGQRIGRLQTCDPRLNARKGIAIQRFGRGHRKEVQRKNITDHRLIRFPARCKCAVLIIWLPKLPTHQIINQGTSGACIKGQQGIWMGRIVMGQISPCDIPDTADIHNRNRAALPVCAQRVKMKERREWGALPASPHIAAAKIPNRRRAPGIGQRRPIADLARAGVLRIMSKGLAVKPDQLRRRIEGADTGRRMHVCHPRLCQRRLPPTARIAQDLARLLVIRERPRRPVGDVLHAVRDHDRRIDAIHGRARHQTKGAQWFHHPFPSRTALRIRARQTGFQSGKAPMSYTPKSTFLKTLNERGFIQDCTDMEALDEALLDGVVPAYIGFDCTADSLHIGNMLQIMMLRWLQKTGHKPVVLMGGGTTKIGDPSGKDEARQLLTPETINENMAGMKRGFARYIDFGEGETDAVMLNNADWLDTLNYVEFLRDYGRHFTINRMLAFDSVKLRLDREQPLTFLEFNYMLLQAYDFMNLNKDHGVRLQMGGSDQWGNIVNGIDLTRRINRTEVFGLTTPLMTKADGSKMGKSVSGAIWLNEDKLSAYEFWQFWRNTLDADVEKFLRLYTELPLGECARLGALEGAAINDAKIVLANEVTTLLHGAEAAAAAEATAREVFEQGGVGDELPTVHVPAEETSVVQLFVKSGLCGSGKEAKRLIADGGARIDDEAVSDAGAMVSGVQIAAGLKLSAGKKRHARVLAG